MKTIEVQIPELVLKQAQELAAREHIPLEQMISLAVTQAVGIWSSESNGAQRAKREDFVAFLIASPDVPPLPANEL
jgi:hypothetical protein